MQQKNQKELCAFEISFIVEELKQIIDSKLDKIYQINKNEFIFQFHAANKGKKLLKITLPSLILFTTTKPQAPEKPLNFCMFLRKYLSNARLRDIKQKAFERIIELYFSTKDEKYIMVIELFGQGNIVLCDNELKIMMPLETKHWSGRDIKRNEEYKYPKARKNPFKVNETQLKQMLEKTDKESIVKFLAIELSLSGIYAEEICLRAGIDKKQAPQKTKADTTKIITAINELKNEKLSPKAVYKNKNLIDIVPMELQLYKSYEKRDFETFSSALDLELTIEEKQIEKISKHEEEIERVKRMIEEQEKNIENFTISHELNKKKAETIYENYQLIKDILEQVKKARKEYSWKEIKEKLKQHKVIKEVDEKKGEVVVEMEV